jgi:hypothetical protein
LRCKLRKREYREISETAAAAFIFLNIERKEHNILHNSCKERVTDASKKVKEAKVELGSSCIQKRLK